jgi:hypothetical protein
MPLLILQLESLPAMVSGVWSDDPHQQLEATTSFRKLLSIGITHFITVLIRSPFVSCSSYLLNVLCRTQPSYRRSNKSGRYPAVCSVPAEN